MTAAPDRATAINVPSLTIDLPSLFRRHKRVHLSFSGGKDSLALLDMCEPWRDQLTLVWANTGMMWPHMVQFVRSYADRYRLIEARPKKHFTAFWLEQGFPADVIPMDNLTKRQPKLQPWGSCCFALRTEPVDVAAAEDGATAFLHGQRESDEAFSGHQGDGVYLRLARMEIAGPLWEWSDDDVWRYITARGVELPEQYGEPAIRAQTFGSLECVACPARASAGNRNRAARLTPAISGLVREIGRAVRQSAITMLEEIEREDAEAPADDRAARWGEVQHLLAAALVASDGEARSLSELKQSFEAGDLELFASPGAALLTAIIVAPDGRALVPVLQAGAADVLENILYPQASIFADLTGSDWAAPLREAIN